MAHCGLNLLQTGKEYDLGMAVLDSAARANPNNHMVVVLAGIAHLHCGSIEDALAYFHRANRLSPNDPSAHASLTGIAHCHMVRGDYAEALVWAVRSLALNARFDPTYWMLIAANVHLGHMAEARRFLRTFGRSRRRSRSPASGPGSPPRTRRESRRSSRACGSRACRKA